MTVLITAPPTEESAYTLRCADADVSARLRAWLRGSELAWPGHFEIDVLVTETSPFPDEDREVVRQPATRIYAGPPTGTVRIEWDNAPAIAIVDAELPKAQLWLSPAAADKLEDGERSFLLVMLVFLLKRIGWYHVHGAALIDPRGRGWLGRGVVVALMNRLTFRRPSLSQLSPMLTPASLQLSVKHTLVRVWSKDLWPNSCRALATVMINLH